VYIAHVIPSYKLYSISQLKEFMRAATIIEEDMEDEDSKEPKDGDSLVGADMRTLLNSQWCSVLKVVEELKIAVQWLIEVRFLIYAVQIRRILLGFYEVCEYVLM
jgi:hypothetical protein